MKKELHYTLSSSIIVFPGMNAWRFLVLPKDIAATIKELYRNQVKGWGSLPVEITIGATTWETSIFPDKKLGTYVLPLKAAVRKREGIFDDDVVTFQLRIR